MNCQSFASACAFRVARFAMLLVAAVVLMQPLRSSADDSVEPQVRQLWQLLDYVAVDYAGAVGEGRVKDAAEFQEMREFTARVREGVSALPASGSDESLIAQSEALELAVQRAAAPEIVAQLARDVAARLLAQHPIPMSPKVTPDLSRGATIYQEHCAGCHGASGRGDGPAGVGLDPRPIAFTDASRARERSIRSLYESISQGVPGTSMSSFAALSDDDRWALAFYVGTLAYPADAQQAGARLWSSDAALRAHIPNLEALTRTTEGELSGVIGTQQAHALLGYLRAKPSMLRRETGLTLARTRLDESVRAFELHDPARAAQLALSSYLDGVEPIEPQLAARNAALLAQIESAMAEYRARLDRGSQVADVESQARVIHALLDDADDALQGADVNQAAAFLASFTILLREGLEALLMVVAIVAFLRKSGRQEAMPYVHGGWISALLAGGLTWFVARYFIDISGSSRELTEGYSSLFAALVLLSVGLWMHQKSQAGRWQRYINERLTQTLKGRSAWLLTGLAFVVVYREVFETLLFYVALASKENTSAVLGGILSASAVLALIAYAMLRFAARLPVARFFSVSSIFIAVLAVVLAGKGAAALQEAGVLAIQSVHAPRVAALGIFPSVQTLSLQAGVAFVAIAGFLVNAVISRR